ncbi:hypothetical protein AB0861_018605, partial [Acinetobacter baumannii]
MLTAIQQPHKINVSRLPILSDKVGQIICPIITYFGPQNWRYAFFLGIIFAVPALTFWAIYSTRKRYS